MPKGEVRIDKWLWATRIFKTRSIATDACKKGRVTISNMPVKPSRPLKVGDVIDVRQPPLTYTFEVPVRHAGDGAHKRIHRPSEGIGPSYKEGGPSACRVY